MALTIGQKSVRVLKLLRGISRPRVFGALAPHGFQVADLEEGWSLLRRASETRLDVVPVPSAPAGVYEELDAFENKWFPICKAALDRSYPKVSERVFLNLRQTSGLEVSVSVSTFVRRVRDLEQGGSGDDSAARDLLARRGLSEAVLGAAEGLLKSLEVEPRAPAVPSPNPQDVLAAEEAMWAWYLEWSIIARQAVHDRRLLRSLGFLTATGNEVPVDEPTEEDAVNDEPDAPDATAPAPAVALPTGP